MFMLTTVCREATIFNVAGLDIAIVLFIAVDRLRTDSFSYGDSMDIFVDLSSLLLLYPTNVTQVNYLICYLFYKCIKHK